MLLFMLLSNDFFLFWKSAQGIYGEKLINRNTSNSVHAQKGTIYFDHAEYLGF